MNILFLTKKNQSSGCNDNPSNCKSGLLNSARLTAEAIARYIPRVTVEVETCIDSNEIDKFVYKYKPRYCILQAIWFTKEKLEELVKLHPKTDFIVRVHSKTPFLATEGVAIERIKQFDGLDNVYVSFNNKETSKDFNNIGIQCFYLPNVYDTKLITAPLFFIFCGNKGHKKHEINVGCFGAIRPMKNQLHQAVAAMIYAEKFEKHLRFHINASRTEQNGETVLKNLRALFNGTNHELIEHEWMDREDFLGVVKQMDIGLQISLTESFNIVTADFVSQRVPIIVSNAIDWMPEQLRVDSLDTDELVNRIDKVLARSDYLTLRASKALQLYNIEAIETWEKFL